MINFKEEIAYSLNYLIDKFLNLKVKRPNIHDADVAIDNIVELNKSLSRFGDGEFNLISGKSLPFQDYSEELGEKLKDVLNNDKEELLVCIPDVFNSLCQYSYYSKKVWTSLLAKNRKEWNKYLNLNSVYYNAFISRPYIIYKDKTQSEKKFKQLKQIWNQRDLLIVEGAKSKLGVGNDLFDNSKSICRILCPPKNSYSVYNKIYDEVLKATEEKNKLVLIALGPTATVLAHDLCLIGIQAIDIGHIDIEYEWYRRKVKKKIDIPGKYTNEAVNGNIVVDFFNESYENQIICSIDN